MNFEIVLNKIDGTSTVERKEGVRDLLAAVRGHSETDIDENSNNGNKSIWKDKSKLDLLLKSLGRSLRDPDWEVKRDSLEVVMALLMKGLLGSEADRLTGAVVPHLISCLSDNKMTVRKAATQCLHELWLRTNDLPRCLQLFVTHGLRGPLDIGRRRDNNLALQVLLTTHFSNADLGPLIDGVLLQLETDPSDDRLLTIVSGVLRSIRKVIGDERFSLHLRHTPPSISALYQLCASSLQPRSTSIDSHGTPFFLTSVPPLAPPDDSDDHLQLGFVPRSLLADLDGDRKLEAVEEVHTLFRKVCRENGFASVAPHLPELLRLLQRLMEDKYLVLVTALKVLVDLLGSMASSQVDGLLEPLLQLLRTALSHNLNGDAIIQKYVMSYSMLLFRKTGDVRRLVARLCDQDFICDLRQASLRQTAIDIVTCALLTFPSTQFDLDFLATKICQRLTDKKSKVKQAALECISVIGYTYGNGKVNTLLKIIEHSFRFDSSNAVAELVQSRLLKHRLPHIDELGLVVYVNDADKTNIPRQQSVIDLENSSSDNSPISSANALEKRRPSAGKVRGRAKFPWDQNEGNSQSSAPFSKAPGTTSFNQIQPSDSTPVQYTPGSISVTIGGKNIRKLSDLQSPNDNDNHSDKNPSITGRSYSSDFPQSMSMNTSGYSSNSNTSRRNTDSFIKQSQDIPTVPNSVSVTPRNPGTFRFEENNPIEESSIPTKPTLGRSAGSRRKELDLSGYPSLGGDSKRVEISDMTPEPITSTMLDSVRNSAAKKKALTIFNSSTSKPLSTTIQSTADQSSKGAQPQPTKAPSEVNHSTKVSDPPIGFNPYKGATFKPNPQYDGLIVGKGVSAPPEPNEPLKKKQPVKGLLDPAPGNVSQRSIGPHQQGEPKKHSLCPEDLGTGNNAPTNSSSPRTSKINSKTSSSVLKEADFSDGIIGKSIVDKNCPDYESDEESNKGIMSKTLRESLSIKRQKAANELNSSKSDSNMVPTPPSPHSAPGSGSYLAANRKPPVGGYYQNNNSPSSAGNERDLNFGYDTVPPSRKPLRPSLGNSTPKKIKPLSQTAPNPLLNPVVDPSTMSPAPLANPDKSIAEFLQAVQHEDWEHKISALIIVQSLAQFHPETLISRPTDLHAVCIAICKECKNLRSQVAKCAIQTVGSLFTNLRKTMDSELDIIIVNMLSKGGDASSIFLRQDVETTLTLMVDSATPQRAIIPLITNGADNKNAAIRRLAASNVMQITEKVGAMKILGGAKEVTEKLLQVTVRFIMDSNQETRYYAKRILVELGKNPEFEKIAIKSIPSKDVKILVEAIENLKLKGLGDPPQFSQSASIRRSGSLSRGASAGNLVSLEQKSSPLSRGNSRSMSRLPGSELSADDDDWLSKTCADLSSSDFRFRQNGLESLLHRQETFGLQIPQRCLAKLMNEFIPRLNDNNSKVAATGLNVCRKVIPSICSIFPTEFISRLINTVALNFASKSPELRESARLLMDVCFDSFDASLMVQPCVEALNKANVKTRPALIEVVNGLLDKIVTSKSSGATSHRSAGAVSRHLVPLIGLLLEQSRPLPVSMRDAMHKLVLLAREVVGPEIVDCACRERGHLVRQALLDILHGHGPG